jgi:hypothetical protein
MIKVLGMNTSGPMIEGMQRHGYDSFVGRRLCLKKTATDTTYFSP